MPNKVSIATGKPNHVLYMRSKMSKYLTWVVWAQDQRALKTLRNNCNKKANQLYSRLLTSTTNQSLCLLKNLQITPASLNKSSATELKQYQECAEYLHKHALYIIQQLSVNSFFVSMRVWFSKNWHSLKITLHTTNLSFHIAFVNKIRNTWLR